ncbi:SdpI family protein [Isoptericola sp. F-RaC21]|uniref:SdpI family protein n=1 Tax=Isoptericola sp. F-RaC21 TaxID=3141452 RepID=UPI00315BF3BB
MVVLVVAVAVAVGVWLITRAAARGQLGANGAVGIRTPATQRSEAAWEAGHRAALPLLRWAAIVIALAGIGALLVLGPDGAGRLEIAGLVLLVAVLVVVVVAGVVAHRAASRVPVP